MIDLNNYAGAKQLIHAGAQNLVACLCVGWSDVYLVQTRYQRNQQTVKSIPYMSISVRHQQMQVWEHHGTVFATMRMYIPRMLPGVAPPVSLEGYDALIVSD